MKLRQEKFISHLKKEVPYLLIGIIFIVGFTGCSILDFSSSGSQSHEETTKDSINEKESKANEPEESNSENQENNNGNESEDGQDEEGYIDMTISAVGDIMFHDEQLNSAYHSEKDQYDFTSMFADVKPILSSADMTIANFETTMAGSEQPYQGYPLFNSPDEVTDAIQYAGIDVLTTANNHSLDTRDTGLKRTVKVLREKGFDTVGTYDEEPDSRVLYKEVKDIKFAFLAYTESTNGLGDQYPKDELDQMINLMEPDKILQDIKEAKEQDADFIISLMHWGEEYMEEPNETQIELAHMMAEEGVDLILGSHPHVVQKSDIIKTDDKETYVIYSLGNFISNQRVETLGEERKATEDGLIVNFDIRKDKKSGETNIYNVDYVPTWVYRHRENEDDPYTYRILPIETFLVDDAISDAYRERMERGLDATTAKMIQEPFKEDE